MFLDEKYAYNVNKLKYLFNLSSKKSVASEVNTYIGMANIESNTGIYLSSENEKGQGDCSVFSQENVLFGKLRPYLNKVYFAEFNGGCTTEFIVMDSLDETIISNKFLSIFLLLDCVVNQTKYMMTGNTLPRLQTFDIENFIIPIPSKDIQQNIIDMMDKAYKVKKQKEKEAQNLLDSIDDYLFDKLEIKLPIEPENSIENRIFKVGFDDILGDRLDADSYTSYYQNIFEIFEKSVCKFTTLKTITKKIKTGTTPEQKLDAFTTEKEIPFLRNSDIQDGEIIDSKFKYIKNEVEKNLTFSYKNEIIICIAGTIGVSALNRFDRLAINQNVSSLMIDETQININFLIYWLNTKVAISLLKRLASIATIAYVNNPTLLRLQIPLPDINIQNEIADEIKQRRQKAKHLQNKAKLELENAKKDVEKIILGDAYES
ncbi:MAG: restriction endonuclease subunit S [Aliarcobacter sp.]|nr:restriction endonuclease subunit S [Aliarcobacter sp.]